jgi:hypothetical protein
LGWTNLYCLIASAADGGLGGGVLMVKTYLWGCGLWSVVVYRHVAGGPSVMVMVSYCFIVIAVAVTWGDR